ncbi:MAG: lamin tail domain-containing protein, partial [Candidatus Gracilibacteria bacterium]|nr:lamin tail domain-containing protein [Candidatus Gracilibacteria bacterium]
MFEIKKIFSFLLLIIFSINTFSVFSVSEISENYLYFLDTDNNNKIDRLEIEFSSDLTGVLNPDKLFLYSNTGGLSSEKLDSISGTSIFSSYSLSGNILLINLNEQDNTNTGLVVNNTTSSHLRIKTNAGIGITDLQGNEIKLLYTSSFNNYLNVSFKSNPILVEEIPEIVDDNSSEEVNNLENLPETNTGTLENNEEVQEEINDNTSNTGGITNSDTGIVLDNSGLIQNEQVKNPLPEIKILFQSPSYLLETEDVESTIFNCDRTKSDCKVNYNLNMNSGSGFVSISNIYECLWNFGFTGTTGEETKCNPNTITYPIGEYETTYRLIEKANPTNFKEKKIIVKNQGYKEETTTKTIYISSTSSSQTSSIISINNPKIIIQSGLDENHNCNKSDCSINLDYETQNSKEACLWTFSGGEYEQETKYKCNPGYVKYPLGNFQVKLKVYELGNESNYKETFLDFTNKEKELAEKQIEAKNPILENKNSEIENINIDKNIDSEKISSFINNLKISQVLPNAVGNDDFEWFELKNLGENDVNLNGCEIHNLLKSSTKKYKFKEDIILEPGESNKFYKFNTNFAIRNSSGRSLELLCSDEKVDSLSWTFNTPEGFVINKEIINKNINSIKNEKDNLFLLTYIDGSQEEIAKYAEFLLPTSQNNLSNNQKKETLIQEIKSVIEVQGKIGSDKILSTDRIICKDTDECSINFDGRGSKGDKLSYFWDFGNSKFFKKANPAAYKFPIGKHIISLKVSSENLEDMAVFIVEVLGKQKKLKKENEESVDEKKSSTNFIKTAKALDENIEQKSGINNKIISIGLLSL